MKENSKILACGLSILKPTVNLPLCEQVSFLSIYIEIATDTYHYFGSLVVAFIVKGYYVAMKNNIENRMLREFSEISTF